MSLLFKALLMLTAVAPGIVLAAPWPDHTVEGAASGTQVATVTVTAGDRGEYYGDIIVNGTVRKVVFDTGSDALWVNNYGKKRSGVGFSQGYGSGSVNGTIEYGDVTIGGITLHNQAYGLVYYAEGDDAKFDGLIGLGTLSKQLKHGDTTWLKNVLPKLKEPIFAVDLASRTGTFTFGYDSQSSVGDKVFLPVSAAHPGWDISANLHGLDRTVFCDLDTGTTDVRIPRDAYNAYLRGIDGSRAPDLEVTSNGHTFTMPGKYAGEGGALIRPTDDDSCILGQPFISAFHVVFDYANKRVSLKPKA